MECHHKTLSFKSVAFSCLFWSVFSRIRTKITPNTETFHAVFFV